MKKILITGSSGYIGKHIVSELTKHNFEIYCIDRNPPTQNSKIKYMKGDIFKLPIQTYSKLGKFDICLHLAWQDGFNHASSSHLKNWFSHYLFLTKLIEHGIKHITVLGSMHEVGYWHGPVNEHTQTNPLSYYALAKNSLRQALEIYLIGKKIIFQWVRGFYIYGDDIENQSLFTRITQMEIKGEKYFPFTSGLNKYDFIHIDEFSKQICATVSQNVINGIINCSSGKAISLKKKVSEFLRENRYKIKPKFGAFQSRSYDSPAIWGDVTKINKIMKLNKEC